MISKFASVLSNNANGGDKLSQLPQEYQEILNLVREEVQAHLNNEIGPAALGFALSFTATEMSLQLAPTELLALHNVTQGQMLALSNAFESYEEEMEEEEQLALPLLDSDSPEEGEIPSDAIIH